MHMCAVVKYVHAPGTARAGLVTSGKLNGHKSRAVSNPSTKASVTGKSLLCCTIYLGHVSNADCIQVQKLPCCVYPHGAKQWH